MPVHVQCSVKFSQSCTLGTKFRILWEWFAQFSLGGIDLLMYGDKMFGGLLLLLADLSNRIVQSGDIAASIIADFHAMDSSTMKRKLELLGEGIILNAHVETSVGTKLNVLTAGCYRAGSEDRLTGFLFVGDLVAVYGHTHESFLRERMGSNGSHVLIIGCDQTVVLFDLLREMLQQLVFQTILLALMVCLHELQLCDINVQVMR